MMMMMRRRRRKRRRRRRRRRQCLVKHAKISSKMVNPRDIAV